MAVTKLAPLFPLLVATLLLHSSSSASMTVNESHELLDAVCKETENIDFCKTTLGSYPTTGAANIKELGTISIILATEQARLNKFIVDDLLHKEKDLVNKHRLAHCLLDYVVVLGKLQHAYRLFDNHDYKGMTKLVNRAMKMTYKCEAGFTKTPSCPSPLTDINQKMVWLNDIILVILDVLT